MNRASVSSRTTSNGLIYIYTIGVPKVKKWGGDDKKYFKNNIRKHSKFDETTNPRILMIPKH